MAEGRGLKVMVTMFNNYKPVKPFDEKLKHTGMDSQERALWAYQTQQFSLKSMLQGHEAHPYHKKENHSQAHSGCTVHSHQICIPCHNFPARCFLHAWTSGFTYLIMQSNVGMY